MLKNLLWSARKSSLGVTLRTLRSDNFIILMYCWVIYPGRLEATARVIGDPLPASHHNPLRKTQVSSIFLALWH